MNKNFLFLLFTIIFFASCDKEKRNLRSGNDFYQEKEYLKAEEEYRKALVADSNYLKGQYMKVKVVISVHIKISVLKQKVIKDYTYLKILSKSVKNL